MLYDPRSAVGREGDWNDVNESASFQDARSRSRNNIPRNLNAAQHSPFSQKQLRNRTEEYPPEDYDTDEPIPDYLENDEPDYLETNDSNINHWNKHNARMAGLSETQFQTNETMFYSPQDSVDCYTLKSAVQDARTLGLIPERENVNRNEEFHGSRAVNETVNTTLNRQCWGKNCRSNDYHAHFFNETRSEGLDDTHRGHLTSKFDIRDLKLMPSDKKENKCYEQCKDKLKDVFSHFAIWHNFIKQLEGHYGTSIASYFVFVRWLLLLNISIFVIIFLVIVLPQIVLRKSIYGTIDSIIKTECEKRYSDSLKREDEGAHTHVLDFLQGTGWMESTLLFIGSYAHIYYPSPIYNIPLAYFITIMVVLFLSLILILRTAAHGVKQGAIISEGQLHNYCNTVFAGWDFCIIKNEAAKLKSEMLTTELLGYLENEKLYQLRQARSKKDKVGLYFVRFLVNVTIGGILIGAGFAVYSASNYSLNHIQAHQNVTNTEQNVVGLLQEYLPSLTITILNLFLPIIFYWLVQYEKYSPGFIVNMNLVRTVILRLASIGVLLVSFETQITINYEDASNTGHQCPRILCWETHVGQQIYKLLLLDFFVCFVLTFIVGFLRMLIATKLDYKCLNFIKQEEFDIPTHVLDLVYSQTLCWLGIFFSPLLSVVCILKFILFFYMKKFHLVINCIPSRQPYRASKSNYFFMIVLLLSFAVLVVIPLTYTVTNFHPSISCSPFRNETLIWNVIPEMVADWPFVLRKIVHFLSSGGFAIPVIIILLLLIYYYFTMAAAYNQMSIVLKNHLHTEGKDKQFLLQRLNEVTKNINNQTIARRNAEKKGVRFRRASNISDASCFISCLLKLV